MSLRFVPELNRKEIRVLLMPWLDILYVLGDYFSVIGYDEQDKEGLFFIRDDDHMPKISLKLVNGNV